MGGGRGGVAGHSIDGVSRYHVAPLAQLITHPIGAFASVLAARVPSSVELPKFNEMRDVSYTVPCAGLHECAGLLADTLAVAPVGANALVTECRTICVRSIPVLCPQSPPHTERALAHHEGAGGLAPVPAGWRAPQSVQSLPKGQRLYWLPGPPSSQSPSLTKLVISHAFVQSTP